MWTLLATEEGVEGRLGGADKEVGADPEHCYLLLGGEGGLGGWGAGSAKVASWG